MSINDSFSHFCKQFCSIMAGFVLHRLSRNDKNKALSSLYWSINSELFSQISYARVSFFNQGEKLRVQSSFKCVQMVSRNRVGFASSPFGRKNLPYFLNQSVARFYCNLVLREVSSTQFRNILFQLLSYSGYCFIFEGKVECLQPNWFFVKFTFMLSLRSVPHTSSCEEWSQ